MVSEIGAYRRKCGGEVPAIRRRRKSCGSTTGCWFPHGGEAFVVVEQNGGERFRAGAESSARGKQSGERWTMNAVSGKITPLPYLLREVRRRLQLTVPRSPRRGQETATQRATQLIVTRNRSLNAVVTA